MGTVTLNVQPDGGWTRLSEYSSGPVDLSTPPQKLELAGTPYIMYGGDGGQTANPTFDLKIAFDGASGSQPTIDVTGSLSGVATGNVDAGYEETFGGSSTSATVQGWTPNSGVPEALIDQYLNGAKYGLSQFFHAEELQTDTPTPFELTVTPSTGFETPEPATLLAYLAAIAGIGLRRGAGAWRSILARKT